MYENMNRVVMLLYAPREVRLLYYPLKWESSKVSGITRDVIGFKME